MRVTKSIKKIIPKIIFKPIESMNTGERVASLFLIT